MKSSYYLSTVLDDYAEHEADSNRVGLEDLGTVDSLTRILWRDRNHTGFRGAPRLCWTVLALLAAGQHRHLESAALGVPFDEREQTR